MLPFHWNDRHILIFSHIPSCTCMHAHVHVCACIHAYKIHVMHINKLIHPQACTHRTLSHVASVAFAHVHINSRMRHEHKAWRMHSQRKVQTHTRARALASEKDTKQTRTSCRYMDTYSSKYAVQGTHQYVDSPAADQPFRLVKLNGTRMT